MNKLTIDEAIENLMIFSRGLDALSESNLIESIDMAIKSLKVDMTIAEQIHDAYRKGWEDGAKASEEHLKLWLYEKGVTE